MERRPENIENPNSSETSPRKTPNPETVKKLGDTAIRGTKDKKS